MNKIRNKTEQRNKFRTKKNRSSKRGFNKSKYKRINNLPPQDTSTDIILGDPTEDYRY